MAEQRMVARLVPVDDAIDLAMTTVAVTTIPRSLELTGTSALVVVPGQGDNRVAYAIHEYNRNPAIEYLLIAGHAKGEKGFVKLDLQWLRRLGLTRNDGSVIQVDAWDDLDNAESRTDGVVIKAHAYHTLEQAEWLLSLVQELGITSLALCASPYHIVRAYLTILKTFLRHGIKPIPMIPYPVPVPLETISPENDVPMWDLLAGEMERIRKYREKGDVATLAELRAYLEDDLWVAFRRLWATFLPAGVKQI